MPPPPNRSAPEPRELHIDALAYGGEGIAHDGGKVCFVPGALPGEIVLAVSASRRRQYDRLKLHRLLSRAPGRRLPLCLHTPVCGGCVIQGLQYEAQLAAKAGQVRDCLERIGKIEVPEADPPLPSPTLVGYRNKMEFTFAPRPWDPEGPPVDPGPEPALGLHVAGRYDAIFDLTSCVLPSGACLRVVETVRAFARERGLRAWRGRDDDGLLRHLIVREGKNTGEILVGLVVSAEDPSLDDLGPRLSAAVPGLVGLVRVLNTGLASVARGEEKLLWGRSVLRERLCGLTFQLQVQSFFQTNTWGAEVLVTALRRMLAGRGGGALLDLYCGPGTLGLALARSFEEVVGVEQATSAVDDARRNAAENGIEHASFLEASVEEWLSQAGTNPGRFPAIVVDPPRAGLHRRVLEGILRLSPRWILYVSCNPATLARDAAHLATGGYEPARLQVIDLFPHTAHVESILLFDRP